MIPFTLTVKGGRENGSIKSKFQNFRASGHSGGRLPDPCCPWLDRLSGRVRTRGEFEEDRNARGGRWESGPPTSQGTVKKIEQTFSRGENDERGFK